MNKVELAEKVAEKIGVTKKQAEDMLNAFEEVVTSTLKSGGEVTLTGFGTFMAKKREARMGVNPQKPGEKIQMARAGWGSQEIEFRQRIREDIQEAAAHGLDVRRAKLQEEALSFAKTSEE
ncbi:MAG: HU family DNA-binding protein, partial [Candidatus Kerfeldbacteria bacterium]|nr:HU family DNA-binding protein [Candidatus Kerfeldbacteria bacterium]